MSNLEEQLKKLGTLDRTSMDKGFKKNLRSYLLHEYKKEHQQSFVSSLFNTLRFQSALNLSILFLSFATLGTLGTYVAMPDSVREKVRYAITNTVEYSFGSDIEGANVYVNGELLGITPLNTNLKEGNYSIRVEKDGYEIFTDAIEAKKDAGNEIFASLTELPDDSPYAGWLRYNNDEINLSFLYPPTFKINEQLTDSGYSNFSINLTDDSVALEIAFNTGTDLELQKTDDVSSYKKTLESGLDRYIQFSQDGNYLGGGIELASASQQQSILGRYRINDSEEMALESEGLELLDKLVESLTLGDSNYVMAVVEDLDTNTDEKINLAGEEKKNIVKVEPVVLSNVYSNKAYDYFINYPSNWRVSDARADYPVSDEGEIIRLDSKVYTVAELRLKSANAGAIYLHTSLDNSPLFEADTDICAGYSTDRVYGEFNGYSIVKAENTNRSDYTHQLCNRTNGEFESGTGVRYSVFWDVEDEAFSQQNLEEFIGIFKSLRFAELSGSVIPKDVSNEYFVDGIGISFDPGQLNVKSVDCGVNCTRVDLYDGSYRILTLSSTPVISSVDSDLYKIGSRDIAGYKYDEYVVRVCDEDNQCLDEFQYGVHQSSNLYMVYYNQIDSTVVEVVESIKAP